MKRPLIIFFLLIILSIPFASLEKYVDFELIRDVGYPRLLANGVLFTLPENYGSDIYLRTNIDNWEKNYYFKKSLFDIHYTLVPYNLDIDEIKYKINIDGLWETDPYNKEIVNDILGTSISVLKTPKEAIYFYRTPIVEKSKDKIKKVQFKYHNPSARGVNFVCSVDNWCQYSHPMKKNINGYWELTKNFTKGKYLYYFFVDGRKVVDLNNNNRLIDKRSGETSFFVIE